MKNNTAISEIPTIDANDLFSTSNNSARQQQEGLLEQGIQTGFLVLRNTEITQEEVENVIKTYKDFFALPIEQKESVNMIKTGLNRGWLPPQQEQVNPEANPDLKETFDSGLELSPDDKYVQQQVPYYGINQWPGHLPEMKAILNTYYQKASSLSLQILTAVAKSIGENPQLFASAFRTPMSLLRGNHYPAPADKLGEKDFGIAPHTDYGGLTLLATDGNSGLEVQGADDEWIPCNPEIGSFVINFGEMLEIWTNKKVKATLHRVKEVTQRRVSVPFFFNPNYYFPLSDEQEQQVLAGQYLKGRYDQTYLHQKNEK